MSNTSKCNIIIYMKKRENSENIDLVKIRSLHATRKLTNQDSLVPVGYATAISGLLMLLQNIFSPDAPTGSYYWFFYLILFSSLFVFGVLLLRLSRITSIRSYLPIAAATIISVITAGLASVDSLVTGDMSALIIGLVGGTIALRSSLRSHFLRNIGTIILYIVGVKFLSGHFPPLGDMLNSIVHLIIAMLVARILERYANRAFRFKKELEKRNEELVEISFKDKLTGLYNRHFIDETLDKTLSISRRSNAKCSVIMLDIDFFKSVNDEYGHEEGDRVLVSVSKVLLKSIRCSDILGRIGGEEFLVILPETSLEGACTAASHLLDAVRSLGSDAVPRPITISAGIAEWKEDDTVKQLLQRSDMMLYKAKNAGRNCYQN